MPMQLVWVDPPDEPIKTASIFAAVVYAENEILLKVGQVDPPVMTEPGGRPPFVEARTLGKFGLTVSRAEKLIDVLQRTIRQHTDRIERGNL